MKVCPVCKSRCFDDMDTCYGCLHKFKIGESAEMADNGSNGSTADPFIPEYFETEDNINKYIMLEDVEHFLKRRAWETAHDIKCGVEHPLHSPYISDTKISSDKNSITITLSIA